MGAAVIAGQDVRMARRAVIFLVQLVLVLAGVLALGVLGALVAFPPW